VKQKREEITGSEVEAGLPGLDLSIEGFSRQPETVGFFQETAFVSVFDPSELIGRWGRRFGVGCQGHQVAQESIQQELAHAVGKGAHPLADRRAGRAGPRQFVQQALPAPALDEVKSHDPVQQSEHEMAMGMQKIGQQTVGPAAGLAAQPLDADSVVDFFCSGSSFVGAPTDQRTAGLAVGVRTIVWQLKRATLGEACSDVFFDGTGKGLYNDHMLGTPPLVVRPPSTEPRREVSSFLLKVPAIILAPVDSVKPARSPGLSRSLLECSNTVTGRLVSPKCSSGLIIYSGPKSPYFDHLLWPITAHQRDNIARQATETPQIPATWHNCSSM
jgi:hypothetical protein